MGVDSSTQSCKVVVCDAEKHGHETFSRYAHLSEIDVMITDSAPPTGLARALER